MKVKLIKAQIMNWPNQVTYNCMTCQDGVFWLPRPLYKGDGFQQAQVKNFTLTSDYKITRPGQSTTDGKEPVDPSLDRVYKPVC